MVCTPPHHGAPSPDDGVHAPHLWRALEDTQRAWQRVALVCRGQRGSVGTDPWRTQGGLLGEPRYHTRTLVGGYEGSGLMCRICSAAPPARHARQRFEDGVGGRALGRQEAEA